MRPHRQQPTGPCRPWDSPGKNTGVGCHFFLQCMKVKSESEVASVVSDSVRPHRWQPTRLPHPWDSPGKNTGVGCYFFLQCRKVKSESEVAQSCLTLSDLMDRSLPRSSVHGIFQARVLEWGAIAFYLEAILSLVVSFLDLLRRTRTAFNLGLIITHYCGIFLLSPLMLVRYKGFLLLLSL